MSLRDFIFADIHASFTVVNTKDPNNSLGSDGDLPFESEYLSWKVMDQAEFAKAENGFCDEGTVIIHFNLQFEPASSAPELPTPKPHDMEPTRLANFSPYFQTGISSTIAVLQEGEPFPLFGVDYYEIKASMQSAHNFEPFSSHSDATLNPTLKTTSPTPTPTPTSPSESVRIIIPRGVLKAMGVDSLDDLPVAHLPANSVLMSLVCLFGGILDIPEKASNLDLAMLCHAIFLYHKLDAISTWQSMDCYNLVLELRNALYRLPRSAVDFSFLMKTIWMECERDATLLDVVGRFLRSSLLDLQDAVKDLPCHDHREDLIKFTHYVAKRSPLVASESFGTFDIQEMFSELASNTDWRKGSFTLKSAEKGSTGELLVIPEVLHVLWPYFHNRAADCIPITAPPQLTLPLTIGALDHIYVSILAQGHWSPSDECLPSIEDCISILKHGATCGLFESLPKLSSSKTERKCIQPTFCALVEWCYAKAFPQDDLAWQLMSCYALGWKQKEEKVSLQIANSQLQTIPKELVKKAFQGIKHPPETAFDDEEEELGPFPCEDESMLDEEKVSDAEVIDNAEDEGEAKVEDENVSADADSPPAVESPVEAPLNLPQEAVVADANATQAPAVAVPQVEAVAESVENSPPAQPSQPSEPAQPAQPAQTDPPAEYAQPTQPQPHAAATN